MPLPMDASRSSIFETRRYGGARIDFDLSMSSTARLAKRFSGLLMHPRAIVLPSSGWYETNFSD
jgi:hypothetical protein